jgi:hypothetical protein
MNRQVDRVAQVLCAVLLASASPAPVAKETMQPGTHVVYRDGAGREWCVTVAALDVGVDSRPWAWFTINEDSRRTGHVPVADLRRPCKARGGAEPVALTDAASAPKPGPRPAP